MRASGSFVCPLQRRRSLQHDDAYCTITGGFAGALTPMPGRQREEVGVTLINAENAAAVVFAPVRKFTLEHTGSSW